MGVTDIDTIVRQWAENHLATVNGRMQHRSTASGNNRTIEIDWSRVRFSTASTNFKPQSPLSNGGSHVVFKSNYVNKTNEVQNHTFQMDRTTDATVRTSVSNGFSRNGLVGIKIDVPGNVSNQTGSFGSEVSVESEEENVVKHQISWGLNSTVRAPANTRTVAELKITETEHWCKFTSEVHIRGRIIVRVLDGGSTQILENDLATIFSDEDRFGRFNAEGVSIQGRKITWPVSGQLKFRFGVSQDVKVWSERI